MMGGSWVEDLDEWSVETLRRNDSKEKLSKILPRKLSGHHTMQFEPQFGSV
jgi:hypothetical protein